MKLKDIVKRQLVSRVRIHVPEALADELVLREQGRREAEEFRRSDASGLLLACPLLSHDELKLADIILNTLTAEPEYLPSPLATQLIRGINARIHMWLGLRA